MNEFKARIVAELDTSKIDQQLKGVQNKKVKLNADTSNATGNINQVNKSLQDVIRSSNSFGSTLKSALNIGSATAAITQGIRLIRQAAEEAVESIKNIDSAITDLRMATSQSYDEVYQLIRSYNEMGKSLGATTTEMAEGADAWLRQGHSVADTNTLLTDSTKLAKVAQLDTADATEYLTSAMKGYKYEANEVIDIVDKLTAVDLVSATDAGGLAEGMSRVAVTANDAGVEMNTLLGYLAAVGEVTQESMSTIGNTFKTIFTRMSDIKSGKLELVDEDGTTETLSDVELTLKNVGIDLRKTVTEYNDFDDVLSNLAAKWDTLNDVQQSALAKAFAGVRQQNRFRVLMANYDKAAEYAEVAENSAGTADEKFNAYLESIEAKTKTLQASFESLAIDTLSTDTVGGFIEAGTAALDFLDKTNLVKGALAGFTTAAGLKGFLFLAKNIQSAVTELNNFNYALQIVKAGNIGENEINRLALATANLSQSQLKTVLSSEALSNEQRIAILTAQGLSQSEAEAALSAMGLATAEGTATGATNTLSGAVKGLWATLKANPLILVASAVSAAVMAVSAYNRHIEETKQETQDKINAMSEESEQLANLISQYKELASADKTDSDTRAEIKEIQDEITKLVGSQADNLDLVNGKLDDELEKLKNISAQQLKDNIPTYRVAYQTAKEDTQNKGAMHEGFWAGDFFADSNYTIDYSLLSENEEIEDDIRGVIEGVMGDYGEVWNGYGSYQFDFSKVDDNDYQARINAINEILTKLQTIKGFDTESGLFTKLVNFRDELQNTYDEQVAQGNVLLDSLITDYDNSNRDDVKSFDDYMNYRDEIIENIKGDSTISEMMSEGVIDEEGLEQSVDDYLSTLDGFSDYYNKWYDKYGSDTAKNAKSVKEQFEKNNPNASLNELETFNRWIDNLSDSDKDIVYKISTTYDTKDWGLQDFQKALADWEVPEADKIHFSDLISNEDFQDEVEDYKDKLSYLTETLQSVKDGTLSSEDKIELFEKFPELAGQADNLQLAISDLLDTTQSDILKRFNEQLAYMDTDEDVAALNALRDSILDMGVVETLTNEIESLNNALDDLKGAYDSVAGVIDDYNENGYYTFENLQTLLELKPEYINALMDENGQINLNSQAYKDYVAAKAKTLVIDQIKSLYETILNMTAEEAQAYANAEAYDTETKSLNDLITATTKYYLTLAQAKDAENGTDIYTPATEKAFDTVANYAAVYDSWLNSLSTSTNEFSTATKEAEAALEKQKKALEKQKKALEKSKNSFEDYKDKLEEAQSSLQDLIDLTVDYIKQTKEDEIEALEKKKDSIGELIDKQKELLEAERDEYDWKKTISEKQNDVASNALANSIANLDDSGAGKKAQKETADALSESRSDMTDTLYEHEIEIRENTLDELKEQSDKYYDEQIDKINEFLDNERQIYEDACRMIDNDNGTLYNNLWQYTYTYTTKTRAEFDNLWSNAQIAIQKYKGDNDTLLIVMERLQGKIFDTETQIKDLNTQIDAADTKIDDLDSAISALSEPLNETSGAIDNIASSLNGLSSSISEYMSQLNGLANSNKTKFWVKYNGKTYETGYNYSGDTEANRLLAANELTKKIAKDVSGFDQYGLGIVQGLLGVGTGSPHWHYNFQGKEYKSNKSDKNEAISDILSQIEKKYGTYPASASTIYGQIKHYAKGTRNAKGGVNVTQEDGWEAILGKLRNGEYTMMSEGSVVFNHGQSDNLYDFSNDPQQFMSDLASKASYSNYLWGKQGNLESVGKNIVKNIDSSRMGDINANTSINIQGDATQSTVNALKVEADKIVDRATKNVMNIALRNKKRI